MPLDQFTRSAEVLGRNGEITEMLAIKDRGDGGPPRSMTLREAVTLHSKNWKLSGLFGEGVHESAHIVLALAFLAMRGTVQLHEYQGGYEAELLALPLTDMMGKTQADNKKQFRQGVLTRFNMGNYTEETVSRILIWQIAKIRKERGETTLLTADDIHTHVGFKTDMQPLFNFARTHGLNHEYIYTLTKQIRLYFEKHQAGVPDDKNPYFDVLPKGSNGVENFRPFVLPPMETINRVFDLATEAQKIILAAPGNDFMNTVCVDQIFAAMKALPPAQVQKPGFVQRFKELVHAV